MNSLRHFRWLVVTFGFALLASACATPIGVARLSTQETFHDLIANVLSTGKPSDWSTQVLQNLNLFDKFDQNPEATLDELHKTIQQPVSEDRLQAGLFALSELSFFHAERSGETKRYLAAAVYAYAFLFPESGARRDPLDPRARLAANFYNQGLVHGLASPEGQEVVLEPRALSLPFGEIVL